MLLAGLLLLGCTEQQPEEEWHPETGVTPSPSLEAPPSPMPSPSPSPSPNPSPTPSTAPSPSVAPSPSPSPSPVPECALTLQSLGDAVKRIIATFTDVSELRADIRCEANGTWTAIDLNSQKVGYRDCYYEQGATARQYTAGARSGGAECQVSVSVPASANTYVFNVTPTTDSFTVDKTVSNTTTRYYFVSNAGNAELSAFNCTSNYNWTVKSVCPTSIAVNGTSNTSFNFDVSTLGAGTHYVVLTYSATSAENKTVSVTLTVTQSTPINPSVTLNSPTNNAWASSTSVQYGFTPNSNGGMLNSCYLWSNTGGTWAQRGGLTSGLVSGSVNYISDTCAADSDCLWNVACKNAGSDYVFAAGNWTVKTDTTPPTAPTNLANTTQTSTTIDLSWTAATDARSGVSNYSIFVNGTRNVTATGTNYTLNGLASAKTYSIYATAFDLVGNEGSGSNTISVTTSA